MRKMVFKCRKRTNTAKEEWEGTITDLERHNNHYEFWIKSRSSIMVVFGSTSRGGFVCIPDFNVGCHLVNLKDKFWNTEKLIEILGDIDGITVAAALFKLSDRINI